MSIDQRIEALEAALRRASKRNCWIVAGFLLLQAGVIAGFAGHLITKTEYTARRFVIEDSEGRTRAALHAAEGIGPLLVLFDENSEARVLLGTHKTSSSLDLVDERGALRVSLGTDRDRTKLRLLHEIGRAGAELQTSKTETALRLTDEIGTTRAELLAGRGGMFTEVGGTRPEPKPTVSSLSLFDNIGTLRATIHGGKGRPYQFLTDNTITRASSERWWEGANLQLYTEGGSRFWGSPSEPTP